MSNTAIKLDSFIPQMTASGHTSGTTSASAGAWVAFPNLPCKQFTISNQTGTNIEVRQGGSGVGFIIPTAAFYTFFGLINASQLEIRRVDLSTTQVTVTCRWEL